MSHKSPDALSGPTCAGEPLAALPAAAPLPGTAGEARGHVVRVLQERADRCGSAVGERALADLLLAVSELLTNAVRHGGGVTRFLDWTGDILTARHVPAHSLLIALDVLGRRLPDFPRATRVLDTARHAVGARQASPSLGENA